MNDISLSASNKNTKFSKSRYDFLLKLSRKRALFTKKLGDHHKLESVLDGVWA